ncbi:hypothetical protein [Alkalilimnicola ehrlichii]
MLRTLLKGLIILWWQKYWLLGTVAAVLGGTGPPPAPGQSPSSS